MAQREEAEQHLEAAETLYAKVVADYGDAAAFSIERERLPKVQALAKKKREAQPPLPESCAPQIDIKELRRINGIHPRSTRLPKELVVPMNDDARATLAELPIMYSPPIPSHGPARAVHVVRRGDTLGSIAARYRTSINNLKRWNQLGRYLQMKPGAPDAP